MVPVTNMRYAPIRIRGRDAITVSCSRRNRRISGTILFRGEENPERKIVLAQRTHVCDLRTDGEARRVIRL